MTVVVGVDGSPGARAALVLAVQEARQRDTGLVAVKAYSEEGSLGAPATRPVATLRTPEDERESAESDLADTVRDALGGQAEQVELRVAAGLTGRKLVDLARELDAQLIVLAAHRGVSVLPGSVSQYVLRHAPCPVLIVPH